MPTDETLNGKFDLQSSTSQPTSEQYAVFHDKTSTTENIATLGFFYDGTGNDRDHGAPTHVEILRRMYEYSHVYIYGPGTKGGWLNQKAGFIAGYGIKDRMDQCLAIIDSYMQSHSQELTIDIIGFSRGGAAARAFGNELLERYSSITIRFLGLFDSVSQVGTPSIDTLPDSFQKKAIIAVLGAVRSTDERYYDYTISPEISYTAHAIAGNENRITFPVTSIFRYVDYVDTFIDFSLLRDLISDQAHEKIFWGAHSDIGGGYPEGGNPHSLNWMLNKMIEQGIQLNVALLDDETVDHAFKCAIHNSQFVYSELLGFGSTMVNHDRRNRLTQSGNLNPHTIQLPQYNLEIAHAYKIKDRALFNEEICEDFALNLY